MAVLFCGCLWIRLPTDQSLLPNVHQQAWAIQHTIALNFRCVSPCVLVAYMTSIMSRTPRSEWGCGQTCIYIYRLCVIPALYSRVNWAPCWYVQLSSHMTTIICNYHFLLHHSKQTYGKIAGCPNACTVNYDHFSMEAWVLESECDAKVFVRGQATGVDLGVGSWEWDDPSPAEAEYTKSIQVAPLWPPFTELT